MGARLHRAAEQERAVQEGRRPAPRPRPDPAHLLQARLRLDRPGRPARPLPLDGSLHPARARASTAARPRCSRRRSSTTSSSCCGSAPTASCSSHETVRALGTHRRRLRPRHRRRHRPGEHPVPLDPDRGRPRDLAAPRRRRPVQPRGLRRLARGRSSAPPSPASRPTRSSTASSALEEIAARALGNPAYSNLPRKFKTAVTGHPSHDVAPEINDVAFVGTVHPEHGPGLRPLGRRRPLDQPDARAEAGRLDPARRGRRRLGGRRLDLPRLRLPPAALAGPAEVPGRRLGHREVPRGPRERVPPASARLLRLARVAGSGTATTSASTRRRTAGSTSAIAPTVGRVSGDAARAARRPDRAVRRRRRPPHAVPEDRADRRRAGPCRRPARRPRRDRPVGAAVRTGGEHDGLHRHRVLQAGDRRHQAPRAATWSPSSSAASPTSTPRSPSTSTAAPTPAPAPRSPTSASRASS